MGAEGAGQRQASEAHSVSGLKKSITCESFGPNERILHHRMATRARRCERAKGKAAWRPVRARGRHRSIGE